MKNLILTVLTILVLAQTAFAAKGGESGGGGGPVGMSAEITRHYVELFNPSITQNFLQEIRARMEGKDLFTLEDDLRAKKVYEKILNLEEVRGLLLSPRVVMNGEITNSTNKFIRFVPSKECKDPWGKSTASNYIKGTRNPIQICMSIPILSQFSLDTFTTDMGGILIHELAHAAGYEGKEGELEAKYVQVFHIDSFLKECEIVLENEQSKISIRLNIGNSIGYSQDGYGHRLLTSKFRRSGVSEQMSLYVNRLNEASGKLLRNEDSNIRFIFTDFNGDEHTASVKLKPLNRVTNYEVVYQVVESDVKLNGRAVPLEKAFVLQGCFLNPNTAQTFLAR